MECSSEALVDVMSVPVDGDPSCAVVPVTNLAAARTIACAAGKRADFNPGNCWVTRLAFEPKVAVAAMMARLQPQIDTGPLPLPLRSKPAAAEVEGDRIISVTAVDLEAWWGGAFLAWFSILPSLAICCPSWGRGKQRGR